MRFFTLTFLLLISLSAYSAPQGEELYLRYCSACHDVNGMGGVGVPLALPSFINSVSDAYLKTTIRHGRPGRIMPGFAYLSDAQLEAIVQFMRAWTERPGPAENAAIVEGDIKRGRQLFSKHCANCHGKEGRGGNGTGVTFSRKRELPIIAPALNNEGFLAAASDTMIRDTIMFGREGTPMTSMLVAGLSEQDIDDVVAYIRSLGSEAEVSEEEWNNINQIPATITADSSYSMEETIENLKEALTDQNFTLIRTEYLEHGLVAEGMEDKKKMVLHFCNFKLLFEALAIDPRVGMFLPCRITLIEKNGKVKLSTINPRRLSKFFNNHELEETCDAMYEIYSTLLEDATL